MKNTLFLLLCFCSLFAFGTNVVPNGDFEQWQTAYCDYPLHYPYGSNEYRFFSQGLYPNATQTSDAWHGNYAIRLETDSASD
ncbi:MAG TPA: hypothetical protein PL114_00760, partial [Bacteroidales bacterium]|nr:hypothetical protein [Bacteroidales bacterium]